MSYSLNNKKKINSKKLGINGPPIEKIVLHQTRIAHEKKTKVFEVEEFCTEKEGGVIPCLDFPLAHSSVLTLIPAAGASSRFLEDEYNFLKNGKEKKLSLKSASFISSIISGSDDIYSKTQAFIECYGQKPKALCLARPDRSSFLDVKKEEQNAFFPDQPTLVIAPLGLKEEFFQCLSNSIISRASTITPSVIDSKNTSWHVEEQGAPLCTIRFYPDGTPVEEKDGQYSLVSGGHGELVSLIKELPPRFPDIKCLHIRNIDNNIRINKDNIDSFSRLSNMFFALQSLLEIFRTTVFSKEENSSLKKILSFSKEQKKTLQLLARILFNEEIPHSFFDNHSDSPAFSEKDFQNPRSPLSLLKKLFFWSSDDLSHLAKPLCLMGMVKKTDKDQGGGTPIITTLEGEKVKICLESPHMDFSQGGSYFNPVVVFYEFQQVNPLRDHDLWILAKKDYKGEEVCYHETVLYEFLGNSQNSNVVFVETPRALFNPNKKLSDILE